MTQYKRIATPEQTAFTPAIPEIKAWAAPTIEAKAPTAANDTAETRRPNILEKRRRRRARMAAR